MRLFLFSLLVAKQFVWAQLPDSASVFAPGLVSTGDVFAISFSPDGQRVYFNKAANHRSTLVLWWAQQVDGQWQAPQPLPCSQDGDIDPMVSPDGRWLWFNRRVQGKFRLARVAIEQSGWGAVTVLPEPLNSDSSESYVSQAANGNLYFGSNRAGVRTTYLARWRGDTFDAPQRLTEIEIGGSASNAYVDPKERYILFSHLDAQTYQSDIYYVARKKGKWQQPIPLPAIVNAPTTREFTPYVHLLEGRLYFTRMWHTPKGQAFSVLRENIYYVDLRQLPRVWRQRLR